GCATRSHADWSARRLAASGNTPASCRDGRPAAKSSGTGPSTAGHARSATGSKSGRSHPAVRTDAGMTHTAAHRPGRAPGRYDIPDTRIAAPTWLSKDLQFRIQNSEF